MQLMPYPSTAAAMPNPFYPQQTSTPNHHHHHHASASSATTATPSTAGTAKIPLTPEQLTKLYSMGPYGMTPRPPPPAINQYGGQHSYGYAPVQSPIASQMLAQPTFAPNQYQTASNNNTFGNTPTPAVVAAAATTNHQQQFNQTMLAIHNEPSKTPTNFSTYTQGASLPLPTTPMIALPSQAAVMFPTYGIHTVANPESALVPKVCRHCTRNFC